MPRKLPLLVAAAFGCLMFALGHAPPVAASTVTVLGTGAPGGATFSITAGPGIPPALDGVVNSTVYILAPGTYTVVWNPASDSRGPCTITPTTANFTVTTSSTNTVDAPTAVYACPTRIPPDTSITDQPAAMTSSPSASFSFTGSDNFTPAASLTFECALDGGAFATCTSPRAFTGLASGEHIFQVRARDGDGNVDPTPASFTWTVSLATTTITSLARANPNPTNATSVQWTATFAAAVGGLAASNFDVVPTGITGASVTGVSGSGTSWTVTVNTGSGSGTLGLNMANATGVTPSVSNVPFTGEVYTIDKTPPSFAAAPMNIALDQTSPAGATATFPTPAATDNLDPMPGVMCAPPSGSTFAVGVTTVTCTATDATGNTATTTFTVTVQRTFCGTERATIRIIQEGQTTVGTAGRDVILGTSGRDVIRAGTGDDLVCGDGGDDELFGEGGDDTIYGEAGNDLLDGGFGDDVLFGGDGNDTLNGGGDEDTLNGDAGDDTLSGGGGDDILRGGAGNDILGGDAGNDRLFGEADNDILRGGTGNDRLEDTQGSGQTFDGGTGTDTCIGTATAPPGGSVTSCEGS